MPAFELSSREFKICIQTIVMGTIEFITKKENLKCNQEITLENVPLSNHEQEVIYHIGGFIVYSLKEKYLQLSESEKLRQTALAAVQLLNSFAFIETNQSLSFLDFSHHYTGLIGEDLRDIIVKQLPKSNLLTSNWEVHSRMLPSENLAGQIKSQTFYKWVDIILNI